MTNKPLSLMDACFAQVHDGLWAWPCMFAKGHDGQHSWEITGHACVCHDNLLARADLID